MAQERRKAGDLVAGGFLFVGDEPELLDAMQKFGCGSTQYPDERTASDDQERLRQVILDYIHKAVLSEAGSKMFPDWAEELANGASK